MNNYNLIIFYCRSKVMEIPAVYAPIGLGTAPDNDIKLVGKDIRPYHLVIRRRGRQWYAISRGEGKLRTETGKETRQIKISCNEKIKFGKYSLQIAEYSRDDGTSTEAAVSHLHGDDGALEVHLDVRGPKDSVVKHYPLSAGRISIGRDPSNHIALSDNYCSSYHASIEKVERGWFIIDLGSKNGVQVDGRKIMGCRLTDGSRIQVGKTLILCTFTREGEPKDDFLKTPGLEHVLTMAAMYARSDFPVLIHGESGTGKEIIAQYLHQRSSRSRSSPFIPINCSAVPESLAESLFFGHRKGAFTGASEHYEGFVGAANGGTLVLDEIGDLPLSIQAKLLRMLDRGLYTQVGDAQVKEVNVRIISSTNRNLIHMVRDGKFREDLYHRLAVLNLKLPPLRDRPRDIEPLALWILRNIAGTCGWNRTDGISAKAIEKLKTYWWPGNVRELRNVLTKASIHAGGHAVLPEHIDFIPGNALGNTLALCSADDLQKLMESCGWKIAAAARKAGIPRTTLRYRLRKSGIISNN